MESGQGCRHRPKTKLMAAFVIAIVVALNSWVLLVEVRR